MRMQTRVKVKSAAEAAAAAAAAAAADSHCLRCNFSHLRRLPWRSGFALVRCGHDDGVREGSVMRCSFKWVPPAAAAEQQPEQYDTAAALLLPRA